MKTLKINGIPFEYEKPRVLKLPEGEISIPFLNHVINEYRQERGYFPDLIIGSKRQFAEYYNILTGDIYED